MRNELKLQQAMTEVALGREAALAPSGLDQDALLGQITSSVAVAPHRAVSRARRPRLAIAVATIAAVAVTALALLSGGTTDPLGAEDASAALNKLSAELTSSPGVDPPLKKGQYFYLQATTGGKVAETWTTRRGTGGFHAARLAAPVKALPTRPARVLMTRPTKPPLPVRVGSHRLGYREMLALPSDPDQLLQQLDAGMKGARGVEADQQASFRAIKDFLVAAPAPANVRASFYQALGKLDDVQLVGPAKNADGRSGIAVGMTLGKAGHARRSDLIFDPHTGALIGTRTVANGKADATSLQTGVVDDLGQRPAPVPAQGPTAALVPAPVPAHGDHLQGVTHGVHWQGGHHHHGGGNWHGTHQGIGAGEPGVPTVPSHGHHGHHCGFHIAGAPGVIHTHGGWHQVPVPTVPSHGLHCGHGHHGHHGISVVPTQPPKG